MDLGSKIKNIRYNHNISQEELARMLEINRNYLSRIETNKSLPTAEILAKLAVTFNISIDTLLGVNLDSFDGFFTIKEAALWATEYLQRNVSNANISYLINYGKVRKYTRNGAVVIMKDELEQYYQSYHAQRQVEWKDKLGDDLNWALSFDRKRDNQTCTSLTSIQR